VPGQVGELKRALNFLRLNNYRTYAHVCASGVSSASARPAAVIAAKSSESPKAASGSSKVLVAGRFSR
jgi:hypothetical protein